MATARMKLLRNRREAQVRQMRRDIAALLRDRQEDTARIRVRTPVPAVFDSISLCSLGVSSCSSGGEIWAAAAVLLDDPAARAFV